MIETLNNVLSAEYFIEVHDGDKLVHREDVKNALNNGFLAILQGTRFQFHRPDLNYSPISGVSTNAETNFDALNNICCYDSADFADALPADLGEVTRHPAVPKGAVSSGTILGVPYGPYNAQRSQATMNKITKVGQFTANADFTLTHLSGCKTPFNGDLTKPLASVTRHLVLSGNYQTIDAGDNPGCCVAYCAPAKLIGALSKYQYSANGKLLLFRWDETAGAVTYLKQLTGYNYCFTDGTHLYAFNSTTNSIDKFDSAGTVVQSTPVSSYGSIPAANAAVVCQTETDVWVAGMTSLAKVTIATGAVQTYTPTWPAEISSIAQNQLVSDGQSKHIYINSYVFDLSDFLTGVLTPVIQTGTTKLTVGGANASSTKLKDNLWFGFRPSTTSYQVYLHAPVQEIGSFAALTTPVTVLSGQDVTLGYTITYNNI